MKCFSEEKCSLALLCLSGIFLLFLLFFSSDRFIEAVLLVQKYVFIGGAFGLVSLLLLFGRKTSFSFTPVSLSLFGFVGYLLVCGFAPHAATIQSLALFAFLHHPRQGVVQSLGGCGISEEERQAVTRNIFRYRKTKMPSDT